MARRTTDFGCSVSISGDTVVVGADCANSSWGAADLFPAPASAAVVAVATVDSGTIGVGTTVPIRVTFSEPVAVSTADGTPQLSLDDTSGAAAYSSGSDSTTLTFFYTVTNGQNTADLDYASIGALHARRRDHRGLGQRQCGLAQLAGDGSDGLATQHIVIQTLHAPAVAGISPAGGPTTGDTIVTITGTTSTAPPRWTSARPRRSISRSIRPRRSRLRARPARARRT